MRIISVGDIAERIDYGVTASAMADQVGPKMLRITDIQDGAVNWSSVPYCARTTKGVETRQLATGDIVFARTGTVGKSFLIRERPEGAVFASYLIRLRLRHEVADSRYVSHFFRSPGYWQQIASASDGGVQKGVNATKLRNLLVPLPPIEDQRRIASVLDAADALRAKRRQAIARLDSLTQAAFIDMFGDPGRNSRWPTASLGQICKAKGEYGANVPSRAFDGSRPRYLRITDIREDGTLIEDAVAPGGPEQQWRSRSLYPGDVCFARSGSVGKTFLMREEYAPLVFAGYLIRFVPDPSKVHPEYLFSYSRTQHYWAWIRRTATTVAQPNVNARRYAQLELPLPPLDMQRQFADAAERIRHRGRILRTSADLLDTLFASLQQRAFRGEL